jgi:hypothetical protein
MNNKLFSMMVILTMIVTAFFYTGGAKQSLAVGEALAETTSLSAEAGMAAYANIGTISDLGSLKSAFLTIEYEDPSETFFIGTVDVPIYEPIYNPYVLVHEDGWIVSFYPKTDPASKMVDVISRNLNETLLEKAVKIVGGDAVSISHYDFGNPDATKMLLIAEYQADGNTFTLNVPSSNTLEKSYAFYRTYEPSFTLDNDVINQVNFVETNADYVGGGYYGTIYGRFGLPDDDHLYRIDMPLDIKNSFTVWNLGFNAFGALALYGVETDFALADQDFVREILLTNPGVNYSFDLTPSAFTKTSPEGGTTGVSLNPTLSWEPSTAPNYEYCIDTSAPGANLLTEDCSTKWISTGSATSVALSNLFFDTTYYWQVKAVNSAGEIFADDGVWWSFTTEPIISPEDFVKITIVLTEPIDSLSKVTMTWEASYGAYYYEVCVDTTQACIAPELWHNVGLATTATIGDLLLDTEYFWQVRAVNDFDVIEADGGDWNSFTTRSFSKLRPYDEEVYNITLPFKWEATPIATQGYEYCISDIEVCPENGWKKVTGTSVVVKRLDAGTHFWQVRADGSQDEVEANDGDWWEFDVLAKKDVSKITLFKVSPVDGAVDLGASVDLSWKATKTATSYEYCFFDIDDTDTTPISDDDTCNPIDYDSKWVSNGTDTSATIFGLLDATTYLWQVRANIGTVIDPDWLYADKGDYWAFTTQDIPE